jgi:hypothetical protein
LGHGGLSRGERDRARDNASNGAANGRIDIQVDSSSKCLMASPKNNETF